MRSRLRPRQAAARLRATGEVRQQLGQEEGDQGRTTANTKTKASAIVGCMARLLMKQIAAEGVFSTSLRTNAR